MALFTSTPKSRLHDKVTLLNLDYSDDDASSGYDSPVFIYGEEDEKTVVAVKTSHGLFDDSGFSFDEKHLIHFSSAEDDSDDLDELDDTESVINDSMKVISTKTLIDNIRYILSIPDLCDVTFLVGPQRIPVHGLKSILGTRSRVFFNMFVKQSREDMNSKRKRKKSKDKQTGSNNKTTIIIDSYDVDVFQTFVEFLHCGSVIMDASTVTGLLCCSDEFDIPDLTKACWEFVDRCISSTNSTIVVKETIRYGDHAAAQKLQHSVISRQNKTLVKQRMAPIGKETEV